MILPTDRVIGGTVESLKTNISTNEAIRHVLLRHLAYFITGALVFLAVTLNFYWTLKDIYFPDLSMLISHTIVLAFVSLVFTVTHLLYARYLGSTLAGEITPLQTETINALNSKLSLLEKQLTETKTENKFLINKFDEFTVKKDQGGVTLGSDVEKVIRKEKPNLIMHERVFIHELSNKIQIAGGVVSNLLDDLQASNEKQNADIIKQLSIAHKHLTLMSNLVKENRDYLIIAS